MESQEYWQETLEQCSTYGLRVQPLDGTADAAKIATLADIMPPPPVLTFACLWQQEGREPWQVLIESASTVNPVVAVESTDAGILQPLRSLINHAEHAAIIWEQEPHRKSPLQWGYLLQIASHDAKGDPYITLVLRPPATTDDIIKAEHVLNMTLPPSFIRFAMVTNGLGSDVREFTFVTGIGPSRAQWPRVMLNLWRDCAGLHEVTARWREFQGIYAYERIMDHERDENTFLSDETVLVPFAHTYEDWCFDRTQQRADGEYAVMFWDHEMREATLYYPDFVTWFEHEVEPYLLGK